jgi:hypothetical protein
MAKPRVVIYTNTEKEKENYRKLRSVLFDQNMTFSKWGNLAMEHYLKNNLNFNEPKRKKKTGINS